MSLTLAISYVTHARNVHTKASLQGVGIESTFWDAGDVPAQTCDTPVANWEPQYVVNAITIPTNFT